MYKLIYGNKSGPEGRACEFTERFISEYSENRILPECASDKVSEAELRENDLIILGTVKTNSLLAKLSENGVFTPSREPEGYVIKATDNPWNPENKIIIIAGTDAVGTMYGAVDFGSVAVPFFDTKNPDQRYPLNVFDEGLIQDYERSSAPSVKERGIWTWGHVIYDYKKYFENMALLKMNTLILWNDRVPLNIEDVIYWAHSFGIKIHLGFSWGWNEARPENGRLDISNEELLSKIQSGIVDNYKSNYMSLDIDGVYFQSFTEFTEDKINGVSIADRVVKFVNDTASEILRLSPKLKLMFGLHATSVYKKLDAIKNTDPRIMIVWEDLGAFPYAYTPRQLNRYEKTVSLGEEIAALRGENDSFGVVTKGLICLDWSIFKHITSDFTMGEESFEFIQKRTAEKAKVWKYIDAYWIKNASYARNAIRSLKNINPDTLITGLIEDGMFESEIHISAAIFAELLWNPERDCRDIILEAMLRPDVK